MKSKEELMAAIADLQEAVTTEVGQDLQVVDTVNSLIADPLTLAIGNREVRTGNVVNVPIYFRADQTKGVAGIQLDLTLPVGVILNQAVAGAAAIAAGKSVQSSPIATGHRIILFGLNQTVLPSGVIVILPLLVPLSFAVGKHTITAANVVASSLTGTNIDVKVINGSLLVD